MPRRSKTITFSLPPEMAAHIEEIRNKEARTTSELVREALRRYMQEWKWRKGPGHGLQGADGQGFDPEDPESLMKEYRFRGDEVAHHR